MFITSAVYYLSVINLVNVLLTENRMLGINALFLVCMIGALGIGTGAFLAALAMFLVWGFATGQLQNEPY